MYIPYSDFREGAMRKKVVPTSFAPCERRVADVLILGGGLAGLRAALAAVTAQPSCRVVVVTAGEGPSGSSFANPNDALGMQVCRTEAEARAMVREVLDLAAPGRVETRLVELLAAESMLLGSGLAASAVTTRFVESCRSPLRESRECSINTSIALEVLHLAEEGGFGTVVVGRRGVSRQEEFLFGSVSSKIIHAAKDLAVWVVA